MNYRSPLSQDEAAARLTMPQTADGFVMNLFFVPKAQREHLENEWREWAKGKPKHLYPNWFDDWARYKESGSLPTYVGGRR